MSEHKVGADLMSTCPDCDHEFSVLESEPTLSLFKMNGMDLRIICPECEHRYTVELDA